MVLAGVLTCLVPAVGDLYAGLAIYAFGFGLFGGTFQGLFSPLLSDYFGVAQLAKAMGLWMTSWLLGGFFGAPMSGMIFDRTGSYTIAWILCGVLFILGGTIIYGTKELDKRYPDRLKRPPKPTVAAPAAAAAAAPTAAAPTAAAPAAAAPAGAPTV